MVDFDTLFHKIDSLTLLGFIGAGLSVGVRLSRGESLNKWSVITALAAGATVGGTFTGTVVEYFGLNSTASASAAGAVAVLLGVMAMGFMINVVDGKIPLINKLLGMDKNDVSQ